MPISTGRATLDRRQQNKNNGTLFPSLANTLVTLTFAGTFEEGLTRTLLALSGPGKSVRYLLLQWFTSA
jgi:hypothetical protein